jgi:hypothetical protein
MKLSLLATCLFFGGCCAPDQPIAPGNLPQQSVAPSKPVDFPKGSYPMGIVIPGKEGFVKSPYAPTGPDVDVHEFAPGTPVRCPFTNKIFIVPQR